MRTAEEHTSNTSHFLWRLSGEHFSLGFSFKRSELPPGSGLPACSNPLPHECWSVDVPQSGDSQRSGQLCGAGGAPRLKANSLVPGKHQEAVGAEAARDVSRVEPHKSCHRGGLEGHGEGGTILLHLHLWVRGGSMWSGGICASQWTWSHDLLQEWFILCCSMIVWDVYCDVGSLQPLSLPGGGQEVVIVWAPPAAGAVLQVKGEQAGEAGAAPTPCQQGGNRLLVERHSAASRNHLQVRSPAADRIEISPGVHGHLTQKAAHVSKSRAALAKTKTWKRRLRNFNVAPVKGEPVCARAAWLHTHCEGGGVTALLPSSIIPPYGENPLI